MARNTSNILQQFIRAISGLSSKQNERCTGNIPRGRGDAQGYLLLQPLQAATQVRCIDLNKSKAGSLFAAKLGKSICC